MPQIRNYDLPTYLLTRVKSRDASASKNTPVAMRKIQAITIFVNASSFMSWKLGQIFIWQDWILTYCT